ncbi:immunoglobulin-like domain-containing protein [Pseudomonas inefficax]|nr:immunoglobulin-like domain-containing protein [Pseudomonas inefficax]
MFPIALSNGEVINIPAGQISASQTANLANDVYVGSSAPSIAINGITEQGTGKQVFENLVKGDPVTLQITDEPGGGDGHGCPSSAEAPWMGPAARTPGSRPVAREPRSAA